MARRRRVLDRLRQPLPQADGIVPTLLYPKRRTVEGENKAAFSRLDPASEAVYNARDAAPADMHSVLDRNVPAGRSDPVATCLWMGPSFVTQGRTR